MNTVSSTGLSLSIKASVTMPAGFSMTEFGDDVDPLDIPALNIADKAKNINGLMVVWAKANALPVTISVIPGSDADKNLSRIFDANTPAPGKTIARDEITIVGTYPDGHTVTLSPGIMTDGHPARSASTSGKNKTKTYSFAFEKAVSNG